jgi:hypothetical protein
MKKALRQGTNSQVTICHLVARMVTTDRDKPSQERRPHSRK